MKISKEEIAAALDWVNKDDFPFFDSHVDAMLRAALTVRKAQKRARRDAKLPSAADVRGIMADLSELTRPEPEGVMCGDVIEPKGKVFGIGKWETRSRHKAVVEKIESSQPYPLIGYIKGLGYGRLQWTEFGRCAMSPVLDLFRPWKDRP